MLSAIDQIVVGYTYKGVVRDINQNGVFVNLTKTITGRVRHSEVYRGNAKTEDLIGSGNEVLVRVVSVDPNSRHVELTMKIPEYEQYNPAANLRQGAFIEGIVAGQQSYGYFVTIAPGINGLLRHINIPEVNTGFLGLGGRSKPNISIGMSIQVRIISIGKDRKNPNKMTYDLEYISGKK